VASGSIAFTDADLTDGHTASVAAAPGNATSLGSIALGAVNEVANAAGGSVGWTCTIDEAAAQYLAAGQSVTETYVVTVADGNGSTITQNVTITITGTNDAVTVVAADTTASGMVVEDTTSVASGSIAFTDVGLKDGHTASVAAAAGNATSLGSIVLGAVNEAAALPAARWTGPTQSTKRPPSIWRLTRASPRNTW